MCLTRALIKSSGSFRIHRYWMLLICRVDWFWTMGRSVCVCASVNINVSSSVVERSHALFHTVAQSSPVPDDSIDGMNSKYFSCSMMHFSKQASHSVVLNELDSEAVTLVNVARRRAIVEWISKKKLLPHETKASRSNTELPITKLVSSSVNIRWAHSRL